VVNCRGKTPRYSPKTQQTIVVRHIKVGIHCGPKSKYFSLILLFFDTSLFVLITFSQLYHRDESIRFRQALKTRDSMHQAALCVRMAQTMLPGVQFPYCTSREVFAILQVTIPKQFKYEYV